MAKRALCVGINDYPGTEMDLSGCVNDAGDWHNVLEQRGYAVRLLRNEEATASRILAALATTLEDAGEDGRIVFTFSGHGSWLPDADRDEPDARDEMLCPYDVMEDACVLDDDLHRLFSRKPRGARVFMIADCCHSGSVARYAPAPAQPDAGVVVKARFLPPYLLARGDRAMERAIDRAVRTPAPTRQSYPALLLSGCRDTEFSYDTSFDGRPNGALTRTAIDALQNPSIATPRAWHQAIRRHLPSPVLPQSPQLSGSPDDMLGPLF